MPLRQGYTIKGVQKLLREGALKGDGRAVARRPRTPRVERRPAASAAAAQPDGLRDMLVELRKELVALRDALAKLRR